MPNPNYVIVKLDQPVGPGDAQGLAQHIVESLEFADVEWAQPAHGAPEDDPEFGDFVMTGEAVSHS